jgi:hypothetical protein
MLDENGRSVLHNNRFRVTIKSGVVFRRLIEQKP